MHCSFFYSFCAFFFFFSGMVLSKKSIPSPISVYTWIDLKSKKAIEREKAFAFLVQQAQTEEQQRMFLEHVFGLEDWFLRRNAIVRLNSIQTSNNWKLELLCKAIQDTEKIIRFMAMKGMVVFEQRGWQRFLEMTKQKIPEEIWLDFILLAGKFGRVVVLQPKVEEQLLFWTQHFSGNPLLLEQTLEVLGRIGKPTPQKIAKLLPFLDSPIASVRVTASWALSQWGESVVLPLAKHFADHPKKEVRLAVVDALLPLRKKLLPVLSVFVQAMDDSDWRIRRATSTLLYHCGPRIAKRISPEWIPHLLKGLFEKQQEIKIQTARVLGWMGYRASAAIPYLRTLLSDSSSEVRKVAKKSIIRIISE